MLLSNYFREFQSRYIRLPILVLVLLLLSGLILTYLVQLQTNSVCGFMLYSVFLSGFLYWVALTPVIFSATSYWNYRLPVQKQLLLHAIAGTTLVAINQWVIPAFNNMALLAVYGCWSSRNNSFIYNALANNILINLFIYIILAGFGWYRNKKDMKTTPVSAKIAVIESYPTAIAVKSGTVTDMVPVSSIYWIQANHNCVHIYNDKKKYVLYSSLKKFQLKLDPAVFIQVYRSAVVNRHRIKEITSLPSGDGELLLENGTTVKYSRNFKKNL